MNTLQNQSKVGFGILDYVVLALLFIPLFAACFCTINTTPVKKK